MRDPDRSMQSEAVIVAAVGRLGPSHIPLFGVKPGIPQKLECGAVKSVGPWQRIYVDLRRSPSEFGRVYARLDLEFLHRVHRRMDDVGVEIRIRIFHTIQSV